MHFFVALLAFCLVFAPPLHAQTTNVLNLCTEAALRAALEIGGNYQVDCGSNALTINLREPLVVRRNINLVTTNEVLLNGQNLTRLMVVDPGVRITLSGFLFFSGRQTETNLNDGGIPDTAGAGIYNNGGTVTILGGRFTGCSVLGVLGAAGQDGAGDDGEAGGDAAGAAIFNNGGQILLSNVVFEANTATGGIGGRGGSGRASGFGENGGNGGGGGTGAGAAIYSRGGRVTVFASTFTNNTASGAVAGAAGLGGGSLGFPGEAGESGDGIGGAIAATDAEVTVYACTFITNSVKGATGLSGLTNNIGRLPGQNGRNGGDGAGGAIYSTGQLWITNSTFFRNLAVSGNGGAGGGAGPGGFGNDGGDGGNGGFATGGAVESAGPGTIVNCTFSDNAVTSGLGGAQGAATGLGENGQAGVSGPAQGGAIFASSLEVSVANSILANSTTTIEGNVRDRGGNISTDLNLLINSFASFRLTNPFLLPLASNGGPTATMAISTNSPGVNKGVAAFCPAIDQRGTNRIDTCDVGAFEIRAPLPPIPSEVFTTNNFRIFSRSNEIILRWPAGYPNLYVQESTNLLSTNTVWTILTNLNNLRESSNLNFLTITPDLARPREFFRLFGDTSTTNSPGSNFPFPPTPGVP